MCTNGKQQLAWNLPSADQRVNKWLFRIFPILKYIYNVVLTFGYIWTNCTSTYKLSGNQEL